MNKSTPVAEVRRPLRPTQKRLQIIQRIEELAREMDLPVKSDLNTWRYPELVVTNIKLEIAKRALPQDKGVDEPC